MSSDGRSETSRSRRLSIMSRKSRSAMRSTISIQPTRAHSRSRLSGTTRTHSSIVTWKTSAPPCRRCDQCGLYRYTRSRTAIDVARLIAAWAHRENIKSFADLKARGFKRPTERQEAIVEANLREASRSKKLGLQCFSRTSTGWRRRTGRNCRTGLHEESAIRVRCCLSGCLLRLLT